MITLGGDCPADNGMVSGEETDVQLVARAARGDHLAVAELYRRHDKAALRAARAVTRNGPDAEDAVSEAFLRVLRAMGAHRLGRDLPFRPYLLTASRHAAVDLIRSTTRVSPAGLMEDFDRPAHGEEPGDRLLAESDVDLVRGVFGRLSPRWQAVLLMIDVDGLTLKEAAAILDLSPNGTAQLAVRARAGLRRLFLQAAFGGRRPDRRAAAQEYLAGRTG